MPKNPDITFIVSAYNDPKYLHCCLASIALQKHDCEIFVTDNSDIPGKESRIQSISRLFGAKYTKHNNDKKRLANDLIAVNEVYKYAKAQWLCFGSSDSYFVPEFTYVLLNALKKNPKASLIYCDCLYDGRLNNAGIYDVLRTYPEIGLIDKTSMIVRKKDFHGFPQHVNGYCRDGALVEEFVKRDLILVKARGVLVVHN